MVIKTSISFEYEKIVYWSDLHLDYAYSNRQIETKVKKDYRWHTFEIPKSMENKKTILLIGGDTVNGNHIHLLPRFIDEVLKYYGMVVMIPGNHEYYYAKYAEINQYLRSIQIPNFYLLIDEAIEIVDPTRILGENRIVIYGTTLWSDISGVKEEKRIQEIFQRDQARMSGGYLSIEEYQKLYEESVTSMRRFLKRAFQIYSDPDSGKILAKVILLTHYALTEDFVAPKYKDNPEIPLFHSNLQPVFYYPIYAAICGHVHERRNFIKNDVICLTNPRGYPSEETHFNTYEVLEI